MAGTTAAAADTTRIEKIRVEASRSESTKGGYTPSGMPIENVALVYEVDLDDLDLWTASGARTAQERVESAAAADCKELGRVHPGSKPGDKECAKNAAREPLAKVQAAITAAEKK